MFEYEVVPVLVTRGASGNAAGEEWATLRAGLNERGRVGYRVVAVSDGAEGRAIIMERPLDSIAAEAEAEATSALSISEAAEEITRESAEHDPLA
jgi:hypothetical protein